LKNEPEKLLKTKVKATWVAKHEPENEAEKLLKTRNCGKNEPKANRRTLESAPCPKGLAIRPYAAYQAAKMAP